MPGLRTRIVAPVVLAIACAPTDVDGTGSAHGTDNTEVGGDPPSGPSTGADSHGMQTSDAPSTGVDPSAADSGGDDGLGPAELDDDELDPPSRGGTITFERIGAEGWYPSRRDPAVGPCDAHESADCCLATQEVTSDRLTPWEQDLVLTLRGPMRVKQLAVYQPGEAATDPWALVSGWDDRGTQLGLAWDGELTGEIGTECLVDVGTDRVFECGEGSVPYCPPSDDPQHYGWTGAKLFVLLAAMPHADAEAVGTPCSEDTSGNWWDAPWIGLSLGELARAGAFSSCQCYAKNPDEWWLGDGCGQFNVFEVVNDNNELTNLDVFSTNFFGYAGYVGEGPCGAACDVSMLAGDVDLIDKATVAEAAQGGVADPDAGPGVAFRRPAAGYRYFVILLDVASRSVQLAIVHPLQIPAAASALLPALPGALPASAIDDLLALRLPQ